MKKKSVIKINYDQAIALIIRMNIILAKKINKKDQNISLAEYYIYNKNSYYRNKFFNKESKN